MIIIGHYGIMCDEFKKISSIDEIATTHNSCIVWFESEVDKDYIISHHCMENGVKYAVIIDTIKDFIIYAALKPIYLILEKSPEIYQKIAENYLFDSKVLSVIEEENEIEDLAKIGVDGVIFRKILEKEC